MRFPSWIPPIHSILLHFPLITADAQRMLYQWTPLRPNYASLSVELQLGLLWCLARPHQYESHITMGYFLLQSSGEYSPRKLLTIWLLLNPSWSWGILTHPSFSFPIYPSTAPKISSLLDYIECLPREWGGRIFHSSESFWRIPPGASVTWIQIWR